MTAAQDMHIDLLHALYVYICSRVRGGGGGGLQSIVGGSGTCMYMRYPRHL